MRRQGLPSLAREGREEARYRVCILRGNRRRRRRRGRHRRR